jgi:hypothetical protein
MPTIELTRVSTPTVDGLISVCKGFNLFASGTAIDLAAEWNGTIMDVEPVVALFKVHLRASVGFFAGVCGPAYAADIHLKGHSNGSTIQLHASNSEVLAGFEMGCSLRLAFVMDVSKEVVESHWVSDGWNSHLEIDTYWDTLGRYNFDATIDLIMVLVWVLEQLAGETPVTTPGRFPSGAGLRMIDKDSSGLATGGRGSVEPKCHTFFNVIDKFEAAKPLLDALKEIGGTLEAGPTLTLSVPTTVSITKAATDGVEYTVATADKVMDGSAAGTSTAGATTLRLTLEHTSSIALAIGLEITVSVLKIFSQSASTPTIDLLGLLGVTPHFGPFDNTIEAQYGATAPPPGAPQPASGCCYEVVLDEPAAVAV